MRQSFKLQEKVRHGDFNDGLRSVRAPLATAAVANHLLKHGAAGIPGERALLASLMNPSEMPQAVFLALQGIEEEMERAVAEGRDCIEGFDGIHGEVARLLEASPWTARPSYGGMLNAGLGRLRL